MAIAEAEPKKSEVAVTSAGVSDGIKDKVLNAGKNFAKSKGYASSSTNTSVGTVKRYNLYDNIKGFRFEMPDGWNDEDIGLFVTCCWEKKDDFSKSNIDRTKIWADIAQSGANKSRNPSLFTINSCLELAERIRYYVSKNTSSFLDNEPFMKFHSDVKGLLPHFSDNFVTKKVTENKGNRKKVKNKSMSNFTSELLNSDSNLGNVIINLTIENAVAIKNGNPNIWIEMSNKLSQRLGINTDAKTILESEKSNIISDINKMEEQGINKRDAFIERAQGFIEVFDYISPKKVKVSDYLPPSVDSTMDSLIDDSDETLMEVRRLSYNDVLEDESVSKGTGSSEMEDQFKDEETTQVKKNKKAKGTNYKKTKSKVTESKNKSEVDVYDNQEINPEPSSTTSFDELPQIQQLNEQEEDSMEEEKKQFNAKTVSCENSTTNDPIKISPDKSSRKWKKERTVPVRIMPPRVARSKVTTYSLSTISKASSSSKLSSRNKTKTKLGVEGTTNKLNQQEANQLSVCKENYISKKSPTFQGFDSDSDDTTVDFSDGFKRLRGVRTPSLTKARVANPDTTTNDPDDKLVSRSDNDAPYLKKLNRKRKENVNGKHVLPSKQEDMGTKVRIVHADSTMKNLVVKLVDCHGSIDYPSIGRVITLPKQQEKTTPFSSRMRPERSNQVRLIEETVVLAKDVVDSEYNPSSDSAKLVSDEHLSKGQLSNMMNESNRVKEPMTLPKPVTSHKDTSQFSKGRDFSKAISASNVDSSSHVTKHHVSPFCESSKLNLNEGSSSASADSASDPPEDICIGNRSLNFASVCTMLKENTISPFNTTAGTSSGLLDANQKSETSLGKLSNTFSSKIAVEKALATLKKCRKDYIPSSDNSLCISSPSALQNRFLEIDDSKLPNWFGNFVNDFRTHEAWKIQQLLQMQQELADVEHRKVIILEKILGSLMNQ